MKLGYLCKDSKLPIRFKGPEDSRFSKNFKMPRQIKTMQLSPFGFLYRTFGFNIAFLRN